VVFQVRSGNPSDLVRTYTVAPGTHLTDSWAIASTYDLSVYGPNGFVRYYKGSTGSSAAALEVSATYHNGDRHSIEFQITNVAASPAEVNVLNAYTGDGVIRLLKPQETFKDAVSLHQFYGWYDLIITVSQDTTFNYRLAGHVETGKDSFSDPALGGLVTLQS
jgi:phospholipase C